MCEQSTKVGVKQEKVLTDPQARGGGENHIVIQDPVQGTQGGIEIWLFYSLVQKMVAAFRYWVNSTRL